MTALPSTALPRRVLLKALLAVPLLSLYRANAPLDAPRPEPMDDDAIVEVGGWILKQSDLA